MAIIGTLPNTIQNGQVVDASPLMADFNFIVNQVNANAVPFGTLTAPSGTRMAFHQAAAPAGWVIDTAISNHTCLYQATGGAVVSTGNGYSSFVTSGWFTDAHALTIAEMPSHNHGISDPGHAHAVTDPGHSHTPPAGAFITNASSANASSGGTANAAFSTTAAATTGISLQASVTGIGVSSNGGSGSHSHNITATWQYITLCVAQKS